MASSIPTDTLEKFTTFGDLLRFLRRRAGLSQMELAVTVGYSDAQISRLEQNLRLPDIPTIEARFIQALDLSDEPKVVTRLLDLAANVRREDAPALGLSPYKGLSYFNEADADLFVGREALSARLAERILALAANQSPAGMRFLAVVGASGSGKSSLIRAGVAPALRWYESSADWEIRVLTPTARPLESLALALTSETGPVSAVGALIDDLARDARSLHLFVRRALKQQNAERTLLIVDQFEELFALCRSEQERTAFIGNLLTAASEVDGRTVVVITLRADFYASCSEYFQLRQAVGEQQEYIGSMSVEELRRAVEEPALRGRWELEAGLVDLIMRDVGHEPGALPLLSHALMETWQRRRGRMLTLSGYATSGGVRGAIAETAEAVFADQFTQEERSIARRILLRLTELGDETSTGYTRRRATYYELIQNPAETDTIKNVLNKLANARLIILGDNAAEVAHEALIREWPTLRGWLEENRDGLRLHRRLTEAALDWADHERTPDSLYRGARLAQALEWSAGHPAEMNPLEREFVEASQALAECESSEREEQRQRELEAARKLAETEQRRAVEQTRSAAQLTKRSYFLAGALIIAAGMLIMAGYLGWQSRIFNRIAASRELAAASISNLAIDPELSVLLALEAISKADTLEAEDALHKSLLTSRIRLNLTAHEPRAPISVDYSSDGKRLVSSSPDELVKVWELDSGKGLFTLGGHYAAFSPDGTRIASVISDGTVKIWDAATGDALPLAGQIDASTSVAFSPDGRRLATVTNENLPRIWDIPTGKELARFPGHTEYVSGAVFSPDGKHLLTSSDDTTARVWDAVSGENIHTLSGHDQWVWTAEYSPDGKTIATASGNKALLWDAESGAQLFTLSGHKNPVYALAFSPDGTRLATGSQDRTIKVWETSSGKELLAISGHTGAITGLSFSPNERFVASGSDDGSVRVWDLAPAREVLSLNLLENSARRMAVSRNGERLAGSEDGTARIWNVGTGEEENQIQTTANLISSLAFSPNDKYLATAGDDSQVNIWDASTGEAVYNWPAHTGWINMMAFTPDGKHLVTGSDDFKVKTWEILPGPDLGALTTRLKATLEFPTEVKTVAISPDGARLLIGLSNGTVRVWDLAAEKELFAIRGHNSTIQAAAFSPDGKRMATASQDGLSRIWDAATGSEVFTLTGHTNVVMAIVFSPDGRRIATASRDGTVRIWDSDNGQLLLKFNSDGYGLSDLAFSSDGTRLVVGGDQGVQVYLLDSGELAALARSRVTRQLTSDECRKYLHLDSSDCEPPPVIPTATPLAPVNQGRICQVTNSSGLNDNSFNERTYKGVQESAKLFGWETAVKESISNFDYEKNIRYFVESDCDLIAVSGNLVDPLQASAGIHPEQKYLITDFISDQSLDNVWTQVYAVDQTAFLAGYVAASVTKTGKVGTFGGVDIPQVTDFMDGFALGVAYYNQKNGSSVEVLGWDAQKHTGMFAGGFCCSTEGREMVGLLMEKGADIILPVAGNSIGWGAAAEVAEHGDAWLIGVDTDWTESMPEFTGIILTSIEKRFEASVVQAVRAINDQTFVGGIHTGTLSTGEVGLSPFHELDGLVSEQVRIDLEAIKAGIIAGEIQTKP